MDNNQWINDKGLFLGQPAFDFMLGDSFENIANALKTIREYRAYAHPDSPDWKEYVQEFFQILGFQPEQKAPRLVALAEIGAHQTASAKALVLLLSPGENGDEIIPGLDWLSYLYYAANYHKARWGFLTNGLELRVYDVRRSDFRETFLWANLDGIVQEDKLDSFFTIYKIFSYTRGQHTVDTPLKRNSRPSPKTKPTSPGGESYTVAYHTAGKPQHIVALFEALRTRILGLSDAVTERPLKKYITYVEKSIFCSLLLQNNQIKIWVNMPVHEISKPIIVVRDVNGIGHYGTGDTEIRLQNATQLEATLDVIRQAYERVKSNQSPRAHASRGD